MYVVRIFYIRFVILKIVKIFHVYIVWCFRVTLKSTVDAKKTTVTYSSTENKNRFNSIIFVLSKVHELLTKNLTVTRRFSFLFYYIIILYYDKYLFTKDTIIRMWDNGRSIKSNFVGVSNVFF